MYWHFLVEMDVGPIFLYQSCPLCPYESRKTNISQTNTLKIDISIWQLLGLERTLLSELPHMQYKANENFLRILRCNTYE